MIRIVLAEDETLDRLGIRGLLQLKPEFAIVGEAEDGEQALNLVSELKPDVLVSDVRMPKLSGIDVLVRLRERGIQTPAVLLTTFDDDEAFLRAIQAGARAFLRKDTSLDDLTAAIMAVAAGGSWIRAAVTERVVRRIQAHPSAFEALDRPDALTKRETEVLRLMAAGLSNREIGDALGTSEGTVKTHISSVLSKLGVRDRTRAVLRALELGYV